MNDLITGLLVMNLDIYRQTDSQDEDTGAIKKEWMYIDTAACYAKGIITNSATSRGADKTLIGTSYKYDQSIEIRTSRRLTFREKVTNIRNSSGDPIWEEINYPTNTPTVFEIVGSTPITDPFGNVLGYNSTAKRSENQQIGI